MPGLFQADILPKALADAMEAFLVGKFSALHEDLPRGVISLAVRNLGESDRVVLCWEDANFPAKEQIVPWAQAWGNVLSPTGKGGIRFTKQKLVDRAWERLSYFLCGWREAMRVSA